MRENLKLYLSRRKFKTETMLQKPLQFKLKTESLAKPPTSPLSSAKHSRPHLQHHLLSCNKLHDHHQTQEDRVSSNNRNK